MSKSRAERQKIRACAVREYASHVMIAGPSVSRRFRRPGGGSVYAFEVTWVPGTVSLSGDVGEMSIVHHHALRDYRAGMEWLASSDYDYLMSKAHPGDRIYDREATVEFILELANEELRDVLLARRSGMRDFVRARHAAREEWSDAFEAWAQTSERGEPAPTLEEYMPDRADYDLEAPSFVMEKGYEGRSPEIYSDRIDIAAGPEGYRMWFLLWRALGNRSLGLEDPRSIFTSAGRRLLASDLDVYLSEGGGERAAELCWDDLEIADYYGATKYPDRSVWQIEALKHGAAMMLEEAEAAERSWSAVMARGAAAVRDAVAPRLRWARIRR